MSPTLLLIVLLAQLQPPSNEDTLLQRERELAATLASKSQPAMEQLLADDYVLRGAPDVDRATWMKEALARCWGERFDIDDFAARVEGDTAVTSFLLTFYVDPETCMPATLRSLITDVWTRDGGTWRLRVRHASPPPAGGVAAQFGVVPEVPPRWVLLSELSFVATAGNASTRTIGAASDFTQQTDRSASRVQFTYVSSEAEDVTNARATTVQARHGFKVRPAMEVFGRVGYARDRFAGIDNRASVEGGFGYTTGLPPRHQVTAEGAVGYTAEDRIGTETLRFAVATGAVRYLWQIAAGAELQEEVAVISDLSQGRNWRATNGLAVSLSLTRLLSLKVSNAVEYRNLPVPGFRRTDMRTSAAVVLTLRER